jgi:DNA-binding FadR family transcriptional regulator
MDKTNQRGQPARSAKGASKSKPKNRPASSVAAGAHAYAATAPVRSHTSRVVDDLGLAIVSGRQAEGALLPGDVDLIERFGVSRTVLREALKTLSGKRLVRATAGIGTRVRPRSDWNLFDPDVLVWHARTGFAPEFLSHLGEMRMALEPEAAALAATRRTARQIEDLHRWVDLMGNAGSTAQEFVRGDLGFHLAVADAADNPFFHSISTLIEVALVAMLTVSSPADEPADLAQSVAKHRAIADAIEKGDAKAARRAMQAVVQQGIDRSRT